MLSNGKNFIVITDHQASISASNATERSKSCMNRLKRRIGRVILFNHDMKHLAGYEKGFVDYMSQNPVGLAVRPRAYKEEFVVASVNSFVINLEIIDNFFLNILVNNNWLIQKLCEI